MSRLDELNNLYTEMFGWTGAELQPIHFMIGCAVTPFLWGERRVLWGELNAGASTGKTSLLRTMWDGDNWSIWMSSMSPNALSSTYVDPDNPHEDLSLLGKLVNSREPKGPKLLLCPEMGSILKMPTDRVVQFFADMRSASDGTYGKSAGNKGLVNWPDLNFGFLLAGVEELDAHRRANAGLGERIVVCRLSQDPRYEKGQQEVDRAVLLNPLSQLDLSVDVKKLTKRVIDDTVLRIKSVEDDAEITRDPDMLFKMGRVGLILTRTRSCPVSSEMFRRSMEHPARIAKQVRGWMDCLAIADERTEWSEKDYNLLLRCMRDSMHPESLRALQSLWRGGRTASKRPMSGEAVRKESMVDTSFLRQLDQWRCADILDCTSQGFYGLKAAFAKDIELTGLLDEPKM